jgi:hypothetical protein
MEKLLFVQLVTKSGKYSFVAVIFALAFQYWGVVQLQNIPVPKLVDILYIYLLLNGLAATPFIYLERKNQVVPGKFCPDCDTPLEASIKYKCPKCGIIKFEKE